MRKHANSGITAGRTERLPRQTRHDRFEPCFRLFVYGTLKRGQAGHAQFFDEATVTEAAVWGRLYQLAAGYPLLVVPPSLIVASGSHNLQADLAAQRLWDAAAGAILAPQERFAVDVPLDSPPLAAWGRNALVAFLPFAKFAAKLLTAHKITTCVAILRIASCDPGSPVNTSPGC